MKKSATHSNLEPNLSDAAMRASARVGAEAGPKPGSDEAVKQNESARKVGGRNKERKRVSVPGAMKAIIGLLSVVTVACGLTWIGILIGIVHAATTEEVNVSRWIAAAYFAMLTLVNGVLVWKLSMRRRWARTATIVLYTLSVVLDAYRVLMGVADMSTWLTIVIAAVVVVLLTRSETARVHFREA